MLIVLRRYAFDLAGFPSLDSSQDRFLIETGVVIGVSDELSRSGQLGPPASFPVTAEPVPPRLIMLHTFSVAGRVLAAVVRGVARELWFWLAGYARLVRDYTVTTLTSTGWLAVTVWQGWWDLFSGGVCPGDRVRHLVPVLAGVVRPVRL